MSATSAHISFVDIAKALALYLVIVGHAVPRASMIFRFIFTFHMPVFFFLSGYCSLRPGNIRKKASSLLLPYLIFSLVGICIMLIFRDWRPEIGIREIVEKYLYFTQPPALGPLWFLPCMFWASVGYSAILTLIQKLEKWFEGSASVLLLVIMCLLALNGAHMYQYFLVPVYQRLPWKLDSAVTAIVFMLEGYLCRRAGLFLPDGFNDTGRNIGTPGDCIENSGCGSSRYESSSSGNNRSTPDRTSNARLCQLPLRVVIFVLLTGLVVIFGTKNGYVNICDMEYGNLLYYHIAAFAGCLWLCMIACFLDRKLSSPALLPFKTKLLWLGKNSLPIFAIHTFFLWYIVKAYGMLISNPMRYLPDGPAAFILPLLVYAACVPVAILYQRLKRRKLS